MPRINAVLQPDLVLLSWSRNALIPGSPRRIIAVRVIGSSQPCRATLAPNLLIRNALRCLRDNGFVVVFRARTSTISGYILLQRNR